MSPMGGAISQTSTEWSTPASAAGAAWYALQTKRRREEVAQRFLAERGIGSYLPRILQWPRPVVGSEIGPMFPGYLFVHAILPDEFYRIRWTQCVKAFVTFGGDPVSVEPEVIDFLRHREGPDHVIRCGENLPPNSEVVIVRGPLTGLSAIVEQRLPARERVRVLIQILQRQTPVELPERWVRPA